MLEMYYYLLKVKMHFNGIVPQETMFVVINLIHI